ncbi:hypothetical protein RND71_020228 [Anisodus tanguticus]|uniref:Uncharacterized protein n=1 Tax=Anisodus tanguticus TaxID=243964 RepID=A0AAE1S0L8_9SOLA|nr:hypothetical protein RND71_020228 [Anisodus tanguticus]
MDDNGEKSEESSRIKGDEDKKVPFYKLFYFADRVDVALMIIGTFGAIGEGLTQPLMTVIFGQIVNSFGGASSSDEVLRNVSKVLIFFEFKLYALTVAIYYVYLAIGSGIASFLLGFCFFIGSVLIEHRLATFDQVFKVFFALTLAAVGVTQSTAMAPNVNKAKDSVTSIFDILDRKPNIDSSSDFGTTLAVVRGDIEFKHVSYRYATRPDVQIFKDLCLTIPSGKTVALVGESGSGKSTVISLIERFYNPESGEIHLDGVEIKQFKLNWLRQQMGLVSQEPILFNETIRDNIAYSRQGNATEEEIIQAAKSANAHNIISSLPQGYGTSVGERGIQLSGGQKQRIAIARAILKDPKILLLDEATSALDAESECIGQEALDGIMVNRTTVVVAHRLTTIRGADIIAVMKNGVIVEEGRHDVLMNIKDGVYASLVALHMTSA